MLALDAGRVFAGRFRIDSPAGSGGMGTIYRAYDLQSEQRVALKLLHETPDDTHGAERFTREAQMLAELRHPGIVRYVAHGQSPEGFLFLAMEWLEGEDLRDRLTRGPLPVRACVTLLQRIADALAVAHRHGIVHRDLKPANLFLPGGAVEQVKILDFGVARRQVATQALTGTGMVVGTPEYMAPEQARGSSCLSPATDLFALGCVFYECLAGRPPFVADHIAAVLVRILFEEPPPLAVLRPGVPAALEQIVRQLLHKEPTQRLADAGHLGAALASLGEFPEPAPLTTDDRPAPRARLFADAELSLCSIVLAELPRTDADPADESSARALASPQRQAIWQALITLGTAPEFLANGALLVTAPQLGSAQDQVELAARAALLIKSYWPAAVVSLSTGRGSVHGRSAVGEVVEQAARWLRQEPSAQPHPKSGVFMDALSAQLLEGRFAQTPQGDGALLLAEEKEADTSRLLLGRPTPCVGRELELGMIEGQLASCVAESQLRVMLITAAPGTGKSRLRHEFLRRLAQRPQPGTLLTGRGDRAAAGTPYGLLGRVLRQLCGLKGGEAPDVQRERLAARLGLHVPAPQQRRCIEFLGELCGVAFPDDGSNRLSAAREEPRLLREHLRQVFLDWLHAECRAAPVLLVLDDLQWGDALSLGLLEEALHTLRGERLMLLVLARPELREVYPQLWQGHKLLEVTLKRLGRKACERLVQQVLGQKSEPQVVARIVEQSEGNALLLEELIRAAATGDLAEPRTVVAMIQARIARFDTGLRRVIRAASIFGETFWRGGIGALLGVDAQDPAADGWLGALVAAEVIEPRSGSRFTHDKEYRFRHALIREAAYALLTDGDCRAGHQAASLFLEQAGEPDALILAEHAARGDQTQRARMYFSRAAEQAMGRMDLEGVMARVARALQLEPTEHERGILYALQSSAQMLSNQMFAALATGQQALAVLPPGGFWWLHTLSNLATAATHLPEPSFLYSLADQLTAVDPARPELLPYTLALSTMVLQLGLAGDRQRTDTALALLQRACAQLPADQENVRAYADVSQAWQIFASEPDPWRAFTFARRSVAFFRTAENHLNLFIGCIVLGVIQAELGDPESGARDLREMVAMCARLRATFLLFLAKVHLLSCLTWGDEGQESAEAQTLIAELRELPMAEARGTALLAEAHHALYRGAASEAESSARAAVACFPILVPFRLWAMSILIRALHAQGQSAAALTVAEQGLSLLGTVGRNGFAEVPVRTAAAEALRGAGQIEQAHAALREVLGLLQQRAERIPDESWRHRYLHNNPFSVRARALAQRWNLLDAAPDTAPAPG